MFTSKTENKFGYWQESYTLPTTGTGYSSVIDFIKVKGDGNSQYITFVLKPSAITGTNLDIALYGAMTSGGDKFLLADAIVADLTLDNTAVAGVVNIELYPAPYYYVAWTVDVDESANTVTLQVKQ